MGDEPAVMGSWVGWEYGPSSRGLPWENSGNTLGEQGNLFPLGRSPEVVIK